MKTTKEDMINDIAMLRMLIKMANNSGAKLRIYKPKNQKYEYCIIGIDWNSRKTRMGGTAEWLYDELLRFLTETF